MRQAIQQNPGALSDVIRSQQVMAGGKQRGFRVYPGRNPAAFSRLGLRPGDLITAINGTPLDDPSRGEEVMRTLGSAPEVRVTIMRNGRQNDMVLNMAQIATEAEQLTGTEGITPVDQAPADAPGGNRTVSRFPRRLAGPRRRRDRPSPACCCSAPPPGTRAPSRPRPAPRRSASPRASRMPTSPR